MTEPLRAALQRIADEAESCACEHDDENCCALKSDFCCPMCIAAVALRAAGGKPWCQIYGAELPGFYCEPCRDIINAAPPDAPVTCAHCETAIAKCPTCGKAEWRIYPPVLESTTPEQREQFFTDIGRPQEKRCQKCGHPDDDHKYSWSGPWDWWECHCGCKVGE